MTNHKKFDIFLSHNSIDKPWVIHLKNALQAQGLKVWLDRDEIRPGDLFVDVLETGLEESNAVALIVSPEAIASGWVKEEYSRALSLAHEKNQPLQLIPVILREAKLPGFLTSRSWIDFRDESTFNANLERLVWGITGKNPIDSVAGPVKHIPSEVPMTSASINPSPVLPRNVDYNIANVRRLVTEALSDEELDQLCMDHFSKVYEQFSSGMSKSQKVHRLIEYCTRQNQLPYVLNLIKSVNPEKYLNYESTLIS
jgi:TIR domain/Effector-associated domain 7